MRRGFLLCLSVCLALALCACSAQSVYTVTRDGKEYTVDREAGTISDGQYTYGFEFSGDSRAYEVTIEYPNESTYWWEQNGTGIGYGGWSEGYDESAYAKGDTLREVLPEKAPRARSGNAGVGFFIILLGLFGAVWPRAAWALSYGWRFKDAEPSEAALVVNRVCGGALVLLGLVVLVI